MIDYHGEMVKALGAILPTHYEMTLTSKTKTPCISYMEANNYVENAGDTIEYSRLVYTVKIWGNKLSDLQDYALQVSIALRQLGFTRTSSRELYDNNSTMIQKILTFEALASETID